jgi:DNA-binding response OmpR family regulator
MAHILIVEDDAFTAQFLNIGLHAAGHSLIVVSDGDAALACASTQAPDLILLDVVLPGRQGFEVLRQLRQTPATRNIPVFMLTSQSDGVSVLAGLDAGATAYLSKPVDLPDIIKRIAVTLAHKRRQPETQSKYSG